MVWTERPKPRVPGINVRSFITSLTEGQKLIRTKPITVRGIAFDGGYGITEVLFSQDGGNTWRRADLGKDYGKYSFREWTIGLNPDKAGDYERLLRKEIFTGIADRHIDGFREIQLFRRTLGDEVEFVTVMWFDSFDAVRSFAGDDYEQAVVPDAARRLLSRFDERSAHYQVAERRPAG